MTRGPTLNKLIGCPHKPVVVKGHVVAIVEKHEELKAVGHLDETAKRESIA